MVLQQASIADLSAQSGQGPMSVIDESCFFIIEFSSGNQIALVMEDHVEE
jgi:hypothetical protein